MMVVTTMSTIDDGGDNNSGRKNSSFVVTFSSALVASVALFGSKNSEPEHSYTHRNPKFNRFWSFSSILVNGEYCMTPRDFLDSVIQDYPRQRFRRRSLSEDDVKRLPLGPVLAMHWHTDH